MTWNRRRTVWAVAVLLPIPIGLFVGHQNLFNPAEVQVIKDKYRVFERALVEREPDEATMERATIALSRRHGFFLRGKFEKTVDAIGEAWAILESREWDWQLESAWGWNLFPPTRLLPVETLPGRQASLRRVVPRLNEAPRIPFRIRILGNPDSGKPTDHSSFVGHPDASSEVSFTVASDLPEGSYWVE
ncbi:MAG: hypothetical protein O6952_07320, partial [Planctomycetota bacterium]|nr:hypothetical protein [Planctomycetota bacterium]